MPCSSFEMLYRSITPIESQELLNQMSVNSYPHMKPDKQKNMHRKLTNMAFPFRLKGDDYITSKQLAEMLANNKEND